MIGILLNSIDAIFANLLTLQDFFFSDYLIIALFVAQIAILILSPIFWLIKRFDLVRNAIFIGLVIETLLLTFITALLLIALSLKYSPDAAMRLLLEAFIVWVVNIALFSSWYWFIDGGGVNARKKSIRSAVSKCVIIIGDFQIAGMDFWFPQQNQNIPGWGNWSPSYSDYLFLAFSTSTAFSSTDTQALSRKAKLLMSIQALNSLIALTVVAARAINSL